MQNKLYVNNLHEGYILMWIFRVHSCWGFFPPCDYHQLVWWLTLMPKTPEVERLNQ